VNIQYCLPLPLSDYYGTRLCAAGACGPAKRAIEQEVEEKAKITDPQITHTPAQVGFGVEIGILGAVAVVVVILIIAIRRSFKN